MDDVCSSVNSKDHESHLLACPKDSECGTQTTSFNGNHDLAEFGATQIQYDGLCWYRFEYAGGTIDSFILSDAIFENSNVGIYYEHSDQRLDILGENRAESELEYLYEFEEGVNHEVNVTKGDAIYVLVVPDGKNYGSANFSIEVTGSSSESTSTITWIIIF